jgi:hypothetical protein
MTEGTCDFSVGSCGGRDACGSEEDSGSEGDYGSEDPFTF